MVLTPGHIGTIASRPRAHQGHAKPGAPQFFCIKCTGSPPMLFWSHYTQASRPQRGPQVEGPPASCLLFSTLGTVSYVSFFFFKKTIKVTLKTAHPGLGAHVFIPELRRQRPGNL